jgi:ABC-type uncharacterized transport system permease subunit
MSFEMNLAIAGVALTIIGLGLTIFYGARAIQRRNHRQNQTASGGSTAIQSGRDTSVNAHGQTTPKGKR